MHSAVSWADCNVLSVHISNTVELTIALCPGLPNFVLKLWCTFVLSVSDTHTYHFDKIKNFMMYLYFKKFDPMAWTTAEGENCGWGGACIYTIIFIKKYWYWLLMLQYILDTITDTTSVFFRLNTDNDTSVFKQHTSYWIHIEHILNTYWTNIEQILNNTENNAEQNWTKLNKTEQILNTTEHCWTNT